MELDEVVRRIADELERKEDKHGLISDNFFSGVPGDNPSTEQVQAACRRIRDLVHHGLGAEAGSGNPYPPDPRLRNKVR